MTHYTLNAHKVDVHLENGQTLTIFFNANSGKAYYRNKIDTISNVKHPGIFIGTDAWNNEYFVHNHYQVGKASLAIRNAFDKGMPIYLYEEKCSNQPLTVVNKAFQHIARGERYNFISYNCQTMVNDACSNQRKSQDVEKWAGGIAATALIALFIGVALSE